MRRIQISDYLMLLRPSIMIALWTFYFSGVYIAMRINHYTVLFNFESALRISSILILYSMLMGCVYVINQIIDIDTDRINNKLHILPKGIISREKAVAYAILLALLPIGGIFVIDSVSMTVKMLFIVSFIMGYIYSVPPFKLKRRPFFDLADNIAGYGLITIIIGFESAGYTFTLRHIILAVPYMLSMGAVFVNTTLMDYRGDSAVHARTTGVYLGFRYSSMLSMIMMAGACFSAILISDWVIAAVSAISLPLYVYSIIRPSERSAGISVKFSAPLLTVAMSVVFPYFFIINVFVLIGMRYYYKKRFNIRYPV